MPKNYCLRARQSKRKHHCLASLCSIGRFFGVCFKIKSNHCSEFWRHRRHSRQFCLFGATGATFVSLAPNSAPSAVNKGRSNKVP